MSRKAGLLARRQFVAAGALGGAGRHTLLFDKRLPNREAGRLPSVRASTPAQARFAPFSRGSRLPLDKGWSKPIYLWANVQSSMDDFTPFR